jgi:hypothetical protein
VVNRTPVVQGGIVGVVGRSRVEVGVVKEGEVGELREGRNNTGFSR